MSKKTMAKVKDIQLNLSPITNMVYKDRHWVKGDEEINKIYELTKENDKLTLENNYNKLKLNLILQEVLFFFFFKNFVVACESECRSFQTPHEIGARNEKRGIEQFKKFLSFTSKNQYFFTKH
jgi:hypothetical protein